MPVHRRGTERDETSAEQKGMKNRFLITRRLPRPSRCLGDEPVVGLTIPAFRADSVSHLGFDLATESVTTPSLKTGAAILDIPTNTDKLPDSSQAVPARLGVFSS